MPQLGMTMAIVSCLIAAEVFSSSEDLDLLDLTRCDLPKLYVLDHLEEPAILTTPDREHLGLARFEALVGNLSVPYRDEDAISLQGGHFNTSKRSGIQDILKPGSARLLFETTTDSEIYRRVTRSWTQESFALNATHGRQFLPELPVVSIGGRAAGLPFHQHQQAWLRLLSGRKLWFFRAPEYPEPSVSERSRVVPDSLAGKFSQCTQEAGETIYLPAGWWHATYNLDDFVLGVGGQKFVSMIEFLAAQGELQTIQRIVTTQPDSTDLYLLARAAARGGQLSVLQYVAHAFSTDAAEVAQMLMYSGAIYDAAGHGHLQAISWMLSEISPSIALAEDNIGAQPVHMASMHGMLGAVQMLISHGASVNAQGRTGLTPLHLAATNGHIEVARWLLEQGALPTVPWQDCRSRYGMEICGGTAAHLAVLLGHYDITILLLKYGLDVESRDFKGQTLCHAAAAVGNMLVLQGLISEGADVESLDHEGISPLDIAISRQNHHVVPLLKGNHNKNIHVADL